MPPLLSITIQDTRRTEPTTHRGAHQGARSSCGGSFDSLREQAASAAHVGNMLNPRQTYGVRGRPSSHYHARAKHGVLELLSAGAEQTV